MGSVQVRLQTRPRRARWAAESSCFCSASKAAMNSLARTLGNEEPSIVTVAVRPGIVDTDMQKAIRETGSSISVAPLRPQ